MMLREPGRHRSASVRVMRGGYARTRSHSSSEPKATRVAWM